MIHIPLTFDVDQVAKYAKCELVRILNKMYSEQVIYSENLNMDNEFSENETNKVIYLSIDDTLDKDEVSVTGEYNCAEIKGGTSLALLHGVYCFAEKLGCIFEFSGEVIPAKRDMLEIPEVYIKHTPSVSQRGIRMHLNFVQDQSFFTQTEFESYIDNIAKQKMNYLCFHMYTSQAWYPFTYRGIKHLEHELGNLRRKHIDKNMIGREKVKVKDHWFPGEFEHITDPEELLYEVYTRYKNMMERCHARGITTVVSIEPESLPELFEAKLEEWSGEDFDRLIAERNLSNNWQEGWSGRKLVEPDITHPLMLDIAIERCLQCIDAFPDLDELQLISREGTSWTPKAGETFEKEIERLCNEFSLSADSFNPEQLGKKAEINDGPEMHSKAHPYWTVLPGSDYYSTVIGSLRFAEFAIKILKDKRVQSKLEKRNMDSSIAIYSPNPTTIKLMMPAIAIMLPYGTRFHCLADYGARDIASNLEAWKPICNKRLKPGLISWLEFDGNMMLAQCWMDALKENITKAYAMGIQTMHFNHWRVRSLEHNAAIAARLCWDINSDDGIKSYLSEIYGQQCLNTAAEAYTSLENATAFAKAKNYNIGFTNDWVYQHATDTPGYYWQYLLRSVINFRESAFCFDKLSQGCTESYGKIQAQYMADLCKISAVHIEAVQHLQNAKLPLMGYKAWPVNNEHAAWPRPEELKRYAEEVQRAYELETEYMKIYSKWVKGCDEQGQLVMHQQGVIEPFRAFADLLFMKCKQQQDILSSIC